MDIALILLGCVMIVVWIWLNIVATLAIKQDVTLESLQRKYQFGIVWIFPFFGATFTLHLVFQHSPDAIPKKWTPWPFRDLIYGKDHPKNRDRKDGTSIDGERLYRQRHDIDSNVDSSD